MGKELGKISWDFDGQEMTATGSVKRRNEIQKRREWVSIKSGRNGTKT